MNIESGCTILSAGNKNETEKPENSVARTAKMGTRSVQNESEETKIDISNEKLKITRKSTLIEDSTIEFLPSMMVKMMVKEKVVKEKPSTIDEKSAMPSTLDQLDDNGKAALHYAAINGDEQALINLLHDGADINVKDRGGDTPLLYAVSKGYHGLAKLLVNSGAKLEVTGVQGQTALHRAVLHGYSQLVDLLVSFGADVHARDKNLMMPIHLAACLEHDDVLTVLLARKTGVAKVNLEARSYYQKMTALHHAAAKGRIKNIKLLINEGANTHATDSSKWNALHCLAMSQPPLKAQEIELILPSFQSEIDAMSSWSGVTPLINSVLFGKETLAKLLLSGVGNNKADPNLKDNCGMTALHHAVIMNDYANDQNMRGRTEAMNSDDFKSMSLQEYLTHCDKRKFVQLLLDNGAKVNSVDDQGMSPLHHAARKGKAVIATILLNGRADPNGKDKKGRTPAYLAFTSGNYQQFVNTPLDLINEIKIKAEPDLINSENSTIIPDEHKRTLLHFVAMHGYSINLSDLLAATGLNINAQDINGMTPLHHAVKNGHIQITKTFLKNGASKSIKNNNGKTPFDLAVTNIRQEGRSQGESLGRILLFEGANIHITGNYDRGTLHYAVLHSDEILCQISLEKGIAVNVIDKLTMTPLHMAATLGDQKCLNFLLAEGADILAKNANGDTPLHLATQCKRSLALKDLLRAGENSEGTTYVNTTGCYNMTPLHYVAKNGWLEGAEILIGVHVAINAKDDEGNTPLHYAKQNRRDNVSSLLIQHGADEHARNNNDQLPGELPEPGLRIDCPLEAAMTFWSEKNVLFDDFT